MSQKIPTKTKIYIFLALITGLDIFLFFRCVSTFNIYRVNRRELQSYVLLNKPELVTSIPAQNLLSENSTSSLSSIESDLTLASSSTFFQQEIIQREIASSSFIKFAVPFTAQAPFGEWSDPRQQHGCEEASALMAVSWARGETFTLDEAKEKILALADWEVRTYGLHEDTSVADTVVRIYNNYYKFNQVKTMSVFSPQSIIDQLIQNNLVVVPTDGKILDNEYYTSPGPDTHMLVIIGYDPEIKQFITNDPGTRQGKNYRYDELTMFQAVRDYKTGTKQAEVIVGQKLMMIVSRQ